MFYVNHNAVNEIFELSEIISDARERWPLLSRLEQELTERVAKQIARTAYDLKKLQWSTDQIADEMGKTKPEIKRLIRYYSDTMNVWNPLNPSTATDFVDLSKIVAKKK